jgi:hypothetical protein
MPNCWRLGLFLVGISFLEVGKTQDLPSKIWQTLGDFLTQDEGLTIAWQYKKYFGVRRPSGAEHKCCFSPSVNV